MATSRVDASYISKSNKIAVLDLIRNSSTISRAQLSKATDLSPPTITRIVDSLINNEGMVEEIGTGSSEGGRPPNLIRFCGAGKYIIGIDLGTTHIDGIITDLNAKVVAEMRIDTEVTSGYESVIDRTAQLVADLIEQSGIPADKVLGIGMAVAGLVDRERQVIEFSPDFGWHDVNLGSDFGKKVSFPVVFDNVTRVMALGELHFGLGKTYDNFICINVGYGIGAGIIAEGKPYYGAHGMSGEFGHTVVEHDSSVKCMCGNYGCLEAMASGRGIAMAAQRGMASGETTAMSEVDQGSITAEMVYTAAMKGDSLAREVLVTAARYLGIGLTNLVNLFDPEAIVIGGGVANTGALLFDSVQEVIIDRSLSRHSRELELVPSSFGERASVMGAISLILNDVLSLRMIVNT